MSLNIANGMPALDANYTLTLTASMSAAEKNAAWNALPKELGGHTLTLQLADGTHTTSMDEPLRLENFRGGTLRLQGNTGDGTPYNPGVSDPSVILEFDAGMTDQGIYFLNCQCRIEIRNVYLKVPDIGDGIACLRVEACGYTVVNDCLVEPGAGDAYGVQFYRGTLGRVEDCFFTNGNSAMHSARGANLHSEDNDEYGTDPDYGLRVADSGVIGIDGTQPTGGTSDETGDGSSGAVINGDA